MIRFGFAAVALFVLNASSMFAASLAHEDACNKFAPAVVQIQAGGQGRGSGFLVSRDGFVITAAHVVRDETGKYFSVIDVTLSDGTHSLATPVPPTVESFGEDFAILRIGGKSDLPFLELGKVGDATIGQSATIIGFPFSAATFGRTTPKFCLSGTIAASDLVTVPINKVERGVTSEINVKVNVIYFQCPTVKGLSGSPLIALRSGRVVGIVTTKLTGIGKSLTDLRNSPAGTGVSVNGLSPGEAVHAIIDVLDGQLANGLGSAVGIDDASIALSRVQDHAAKIK